MNGMTWKCVLLGGAACALSGCVYLDDAIKVANLANGVGSPSPAPSAAATPAPAPAPAAEPVVPPQANSQWASAEALSGMFALAFSNMGFVYGGTELKPGEYIRLGSTNQEENSNRPGWFERARLKDDASGSQWWRVKFAGDQTNSITVEGLYSPSLQKLVRMRALLPGEAVPREFACDNVQPMPPTRAMSPKSVGGVDAGVESVTVPAGTFRAHHFKVEHGGDGLDWWISDTVPGGLVKMSGRTSSGGTMQLQAYGTNATSELGSF